jgi:hypothetical protein
VAELGGLKSLAILNLDYTAIDDKALGSLRALPSLRELRLNMANVTDAGIDDLKSMSALTKLNLYHTLVTEKGLQQLMAALPHCAIVFDRDSALPSRRGRS